MNKQRRNVLTLAALELDGVTDDLLLVASDTDESNFKNMLGTLKEWSAKVEAIAEEESEAYDNLSEGLRQSNRGMQMDEASSALYTCAEELKNVHNDILNFKIELPDCIAKKSAEDIVGTVNSYKKRVADIVSDIEYYSL